MSAFAKYDYFLVFCEVFDGFEAFGVGVESGDFIGKAIITR